MRKITSLVCGLFIAFASVAQDAELTQVEEVQQRTETLEEEVAKLKKLKISGYIQTQYQYGEKDASLGVGKANNQPEESFDRFGIRRGRIKFTYEEALASGVVQLDITEKGLGVKDAYLNVKDPWLNTLQLRAGIFDRPFGNEISYSSSRRESPERSTVFQTLFPGERDLGAMLILQPAKTSQWNFLKLEAGFFAGNGIEQESDNRKDFIGHLSATKNIGDNVSWGAGISYYNGSVYQGSENIYSMDGSVFIVNNALTNKGKFAKREYVGFDVQFSTMSIAGLTQLRAEYLFGQQPGAAKSSKSPTTSQLPTVDTYIRDFDGGYILLVQDLGDLPFSAVLKYDWYDPNTQVSGNQVGENGTSEADLSLSTFGIGALWKVSNNLRLQAYYEIKKNETTTQIANRNEDLKDNVFTLRLQYKF